MIKLDVKDGKVAALLKTGDDYVATNLNDMTAQNIINAGKVKKSDNPRYPILVNDEWYFAGEIEIEEKKAKVAKK